MAIILEPVINITMMKMGDNLLDKFNVIKKYCWRWKYKSLNINIFPLLVGCAFVLLGLETYTYIGFVKKFIFVDSRFFLVMAVFSGLLLIGKKINNLCDLTFKVNGAILSISSVLYLAMQILEARHFRNYIFSTYHVQIANFLNIVFFSAVIFIMSKLIKQKFRIRRFSIYHLIVSIILTASFLIGVVNTVDQAVYTDIYILFHFNASYDFKMHERWGLYYNYIKFVKANTPENASILVPPQELPWYSTGNVGLDRYFLFPRNLANGSYDKAMDLQGYDYVLLVWGEWNDADKSLYGWPKIPINSEKVIYYEAATGVVREQDGNYDPRLIPASGAWGIIKIRK
jgi:hypothetical protein